MPARQPVLLLLIRLLLAAEWHGGASRHTVNDGPVASRVPAGGIHRTPPAPTKKLKAPLVRTAGRHFHFNKSEATLASVSADNSGVGRPQRCARLTLRVLELPSTPDHPAGTGVNDGEAGTL